MEDTWIHDALARYIGEVFRKNIGGKWNIVLDDPNYAYVGLPQLNYPTPVCPFTLLTASIDRNRGDFLRMVYINTKKRDA